MAEHLKLINTGNPPTFGGLVMTEIAQSVLRSLEFAHSEGQRLTMIAGVPGAGKSEAVLRYVQNTPGCVLHSATAGEGSIWNLASALMRQLDLGKPDAQNMASAREKIGEAIGVDGLLIVDEAQYLVQKSAKAGANLEAFEWLRSAAEDGWFSVAFVGDLSLVTLVRKLPQLRRRIRKPAFIREIARADVAMIAAHRGMNAAISVDALYAVARRFGGIGDVVNVLAHAKLFAGSGPVEPPHIAAAIEDLNLTPKGGI